MNIRLDLASTSWESFVFIGMRNTELEESAVSPVRTPRVLHQPESFAVLVVLQRTVAYNGNCMINLSSVFVAAVAVTFLEDATLVTHKASWV